MPAEAQSRSAIITGEGGGQKMKHNTFLILIAFLILPSGCEYHSITSSTTASQVTLWKTVPNPFTPPTPQELEKAHYAFPDFPRFTAEKLYQIVTDLKSTDAAIAVAANVVYEDMVLIDVRSADRFKKPGHIEGAINMPLSFYWVLDPQEEPKQEDVLDYEQEMYDLSLNLTNLPRDKMLIFYDETPNDMAACLAARTLLDKNHGYDRANVFVLFGGFYHYMLDMAHPWVFS
jgi:rhodanese-related sulfurtransferase